MWATQAHSALTAPNAAPTPTSTPSKLISLSKPRPPSTLHRSIRPQSTGPSQWANRCLTGPVVIALVRLRRKNEWLPSLWKRPQICVKESATTSSCRINWWIWSRILAVSTKKRGEWTRTTSHVSTQTSASSRRLGPRSMNRDRSTTTASAKMRSSIPSLTGSALWSATAMLTSKEWNMSSRSARIQMRASNHRSDKRMTSWLPSESATGKTLKRSTDLMSRMRLRQTRVMTSAATFATSNLKSPRPSIRSRSLTDWLTRRHSIWRAKSSNLPSAIERSHLWRTRWAISWTNWITWRALSSDTRMKMVTCRGE